MGEEVILLF